MATKFVDFARPFRLTLPGGTFMDFKEGPQQVDDALLSHWFVAANIRGAKGDSQPGTQEYLKEDMEIARQLELEEQASQDRQAKLSGMRKRASEREIQEAILRSRHSEMLTPAQQELINAANRQRDIQAKQMAPPPGGESHQINKGGPLPPDIILEPSLETPPPGGESNHYAEPPASAAPLDEVPAGGEAAVTDVGDGQEDSPDSAKPKPKGKPKLNT